MENTAVALAADASPHLPLLPPQHASGQGANGSRSQLTSFIKAKTIKTTHQRASKGLPEHPYHMESSGNTQRQTAKAHWAYNQGKLQGPQVPQPSHQHAAPQWVPQRPVGALADSCPTPGAARGQRRAVPAPSTHGAPAPHQPSVCPAAGTTRAPRRADGGCPRTPQKGLSV